MEDARREPYVDSEAIAGELRPVQPPRPPRAWVTRLGAALRTGVVAGLLPTAVVFAAYYAANHAYPLPWLQIASLAAVYGPAVGISLAVGTELLVMACDRVARRAPGLWLVANPVSAGALAGALGGIVPGVIGVTVFGGYRGPFAGTALLAGALIAGALLVAVPLARRARRVRRPDAQGERRAVAVAAVLATAIVATLAAIVAPLLVGAAFAELRGELATNGGVVGAAAGAVGGGIVGVYVGLVIALARTLGGRAGGVSAPA